MWSNMCSKWVFWIFISQFEMLQKLLAKFQFRKSCKRCQDHCVAVSCGTVKHFYFAFSLFATSRLSCNDVAAKLVCIKKYICAWNDMWIASLLKIESLKMSNKCKYYLNIIFPCASAREHISRSALGKKNFYFRKKIFTDLR